jgi:hypothetical protein
MQHIMKPVVARILFGQRSVTAFYHKELSLIPTGPRSEDSQGVDGSRPQPLNMGWS